MIITSILTWLSGGPSPVTEARTEREERKRKLNIVMREFEETHDKMGQACASVVETAEQTRAEIAKASAATRACVAVQAEKDSGGMP